MAYSFRRKEGKARMACVVFVTSNRTHELRISRFLGPTSNQELLSFELCLTTSESSRHWRQCIEDVDILLLDYGIGVNLPWREGEGKGSARLP